MVKCYRSVPAGVCDHVLRHFDDVAQVGQQWLPHSRQTENPAVVEPTRLRRACTPSPVLESGAFLQKLWLQSV